MQEELPSDSTVLELLALERRKVEQMASAMAELQSELTRRRRSEDEALREARSEIAALKGIGKAMAL